MYEPSLASKATMKSFSEASSPSNLLVFIHSRHLQAHACESTSWSDIFMM